MAKGMTTATLVGVVLLSMVFLAYSIDALNYVRAEEVMNGTFGTSITPNATYNFPNNLSVGGCLNMPNGGKVCANETCTMIYSPDGGSITEACN